MSRRHKNEHHEEHADESWLIPYADLLTLLLALFIVLYAMNSVDSKKFEDMSKAFNSALDSGVGVLENTSVITTGEEMDRNNKTKPKPEDATTDAKRNELMKKEQQALEDLKKQIDKYIQANGLTNQLDTKLNQSQLMITISDNALFPSGSSKVKPDARILAKAIANMLTSYSDYEIVVSGHTDNEPISNSDFQSNWDLSSSRAIRFMDVLLLNENLNPKLFSAIGYGEYRPVDSNDTVLGRSKNRRVEVSIIRKFLDVTKAQEMPATPKA
ncbi:flagellar motor protein MotB [Paenibacillus nasutitermitis]|uniref:Motility protein B n=1 Tax=Paenibacillus nasutitermitis TaxID=1652958 RepID=A0A916ZGN4_9BACL|nr:flagellar motor protein MotB [Paenibacillus nasutitermitis]GGD96662.1 motility protein B [Paenibacillus nasutitermitis]